MIELQLIVLKGRHILAQGNPGKTGSRPGLVNMFECRPREKVHKREFIHSDEIDQSIFVGHTAILFPAGGRLAPEKNAVKKCNINMYSILKSTKQS